MSLNKITEYFFIFVLISFSHSGLIKWLFFPIDPTILFAILSLPSFFIWAKYKFYTRENPLIFGVPIFLVFNLILIATSVYSISDSYFIFKSAVIVSNVFAFVLPLLVVNSQKSFMQFKEVFKFLFLITLIFLAFQYIDNQFIDIRYHPTENEFGIRIPDYLTFSYFLGSGVIFLLGSKDSLSKLMIFLSVLFMLLLAAKGPLLFLIIVALIKYRKTLSPFQFKFWLFCILFFFLLFFLVSVLRFSLFEPLLGRLIFFSDGLEEDKSSLARVILLNNGIDLIKSHSIFGVGLGGFAKALGDADGRLSPHNIFIEIWAECGIFSLIFLIFLCFFFYSRFKIVLNKYSFPVGENVIYLCLFLFLGNLVSAFLEDMRITYFWIGLAISFYSIRIRTASNLT